MLDYFTCKDYQLDIEKVYILVKNKYLENKNILISGVTNPEEQKFLGNI